MIPCPDKRKSSLNSDDFQYYYFPQQLLQLPVILSTELWNQRPLKPEHSLIYSGIYTPRLLRIGHFTTSEVLRTGTVGTGIIRDGEKTF